MSPSTIESQSLHELLHEHGSHLDDNEDDIRLDVKVEVWTDEKLLQIKNHTATMYENRIYIFGGYTGLKNLNRLCILDPQTNTCTSMKFASDTHTPDGRNGHASVVIGNKMYVIGGWVGKGFFASSKLFVLDLNTLKWEGLQTSGLEPGPCNMHTADYYKGKIYIFRGGDGKSYLSDLHSLDISDFTWERVIGSGTPPPPRANHTSTIIKHHLYIFGGWDGVNRLNDLYRINLESLTWEHICADGWTGIPPPRAGMKMINVKDQIYMFGGSGSLAMFHSDLWVYQPARNDWFQCRVQEQNTTNKNHNKNSSNSNSQQENSNINIDSTKPITLESITMQNPLSSRSGHSMTLLKNRLFIVGGSLGRDYYKNYLIIDIDPQPEFHLLQPASASSSLQSSSQSTSENASLSHSNGLFACSLLSGLASSYNNPEFADICFDVGGEKIYAHRVILSMLGETFNALLTVGMQESKHKLVKMNIIEPAIFKIILRSVYMNRLDLTASESTDMNLLFELFRCCDQLLISKLLSVVLQTIKSIITQDNAKKILEMALAFNAEYLVKYCQWVIRRSEYG